MKVIPLHKNEEELVKKAIKKNKMAQELLFGMHAPKMLSVCRYYINDLQHAEEVMLNGFFKVFTQIGTFKFQGSFEGWVRKIMIREAISFLRQKKNITFLTEQNVNNQTHTSNNIERNIALEDIQQLIDELPEGYKMVFIMYVIEGYKHQEIAEELGITENTSKTQLFKARRQLQDKITNRNKTGYGNA